MKHKIGSRTSYLVQLSAKETPVFEILVNHNGGMGGGYREYYCLNDFDPVEKEGLFKVHTLLGNDVIINTQWISTIREMKMVEVEHMRRRWVESERKFYDTDKRSTLIYMIKPNDTYELIGNEEGSIQTTDLNY